MITWLFIPLAMASNIFVSRVGRRKIPFIMTTGVFWQPSLWKTVFRSSAIAIVVVSVKMSVHHIRDFITWSRISSDPCMPWQKVLQDLWYVSDPLKVAAAASYQSKPRGW